MTPEQKQRLFDAGYSPAKISAFERVKGFELETQQDSTQDRLAEVGLSTADTIRQNILGTGEFADQSSLRRGVQATAAGFSAAPRGALALSPEPVRTGFEKAGEVIGKGFTKLVDFFSDRKALQEFTQKNPEKTRQIEEVLGTVAAGGEIAGTIAGAEGLAGTLRTTAKTAAKVPGAVKRLTPDVVKDFQAKLSPTTRKQAVDSLADTYKTTLVAGDSALNKALRKEANKQSFGDNVVTREDLIRNLSEDGILPDINGKKADFTQALDDISARQDALASQIDPLLDTIPVLTKLDDLRADALAKVKAADEFVENRQGAIRQTEKFFDSFEESFGANLTAKQVNLISKRMNQRTKGFDKEAFVQDTANLIGQTARARVDLVSPTKVVREANREWGRLANLKRTALLLDGKKIQISFLAEALGRYGGVIAASGVAAGVLTGSGALVIAGLAAKIGGDKIADFMRSKAYSPKVKAIIANTIKKDKELSQQLVDEASKANKATLTRLLLPEPGQTSVTELPAAKDLGRGAGSKTIGPRNSSQGGFINVSEIVDALKGKKSNPQGRNVSQEVTETLREFGSTVDADPAMVEILRMYADKDPMVTRTYAITAVDELRGK